MKIHRFFIEQNIDDLHSGDEIEISDRDVIHQMRNVLRIKEGEKVILLDGKGTMFSGTISKVMKKSLIFSKEIMKKFSRKNEVMLTVYPAVIKKDKLEYVFQKCTEIGVLEFCPIVSDRTEKQNFNLDRAKTIIKEAAEQSEKSYLPSVSSPVGLSELIAKHETGEEVIDVRNTFYLDIEAPIINVQNLIESVKLGNLSFFVGPEGGWSETDRNMFNKIGIKSVSLGETVLRAETASIAIASLMLLGR